MSLHTSRRLVTRIGFGSVHETVEALLEAIARRGLALHARIEHGATVDAGPRSVLLLVDDPAECAPLLADCPLLGLDLPLKLLVWADHDGTLKVSFDDPTELAEPYALDGHADRLARLREHLVALQSEVTHGDAVPGTVVDDGPVLPVH